MTLTSIFELILRIPLRKSSIGVPLAPVRVLRHWVALSRKPLQSQGFLLIGDYRE